MTSLDALNMKATTFIAIATPPQIVPASAMFFPASSPALALIWLIETMPITTAPIESGMPKRPQQQPGKSARMPHTSDAIARPWLRGGMLP